MRNEFGAKILRRLGSPSLLLLSRRQTALIMSAFLIQTYDAVAHLASLPEERVMQEWDVERDELPLLLLSRVSCYSFRRCS